MEETYKHMIYMNSYSSKFYSLIPAELAFFTIRILWTIWADSKTTFVLTVFIHNTDFSIGSWWSTGVWNPWKKPRKLYWQCEHYSSITDCCRRSCLHNPHVFCILHTFPHCRSSHIEHPLSTKLHLVEELYTHCKPREYSFQNKSHHQDNQNFGSI